MADSTKVVEETPKDSVEVDEDSFFGWLQTKLKKKEERKSPAKRSASGKVKTIAVVTAQWNMTTEGKSTGVIEYCSYICKERGTDRFVETKGYQAIAHHVYHKVILPWIEGEFDNDYIKEVAEAFRVPETKP